MNSLTRIAGLRLCVVALAMWAFVFAPMAQSAHVEMELSEYCSVGHDDGFDNENNSDGHDGGDHAHCCASCHFSSLRQESELAGIILLPAEHKAAPTRQDYTSTPASGIFHPPRV